MRGRRSTGPLARRVRGPPTDLDRRALLAGPSLNPVTAAVHSAGAGSPHRGRYGAAPTARREPRASAGTDRWWHASEQANHPLSTRRAPPTGAAVAVGCSRTWLTATRARPVAGPPTSAEPAPPERRAHRPQCIPVLDRHRRKPRERDLSGASRRRSGSLARSSGPSPGTTPGEPPGSDCFRSGCTVRTAPGAAATHDAVPGNADKPPCARSVREYLRPGLRRRTPGVSPGKAALRNAPLECNAEPGCCSAAEPSGCRDNQLWTKNFIFVIVELLLQNFGVRFTSIMVRATVYGGYVRR
jgi:hypothetical protein